MRIIYADTGLRNDIGHHANSCRLIAREWRSRGHEVTVAASDLIEPGLRAELGALAHFRINTYWGGTGDPFCGWLSGFFHSASVTTQDLEALEPFAPDDLLYVNSIMPAQLMALANFMGAPGVRPHVVAELGTGPGLEFEWRDAMLHFSPKDPRQDPRGVLYRFAAQQLAARGTASPHLFTFDQTCSAIYGNLLGRAVHTLPLPHHAAQWPRPRIGRRPVTIGVLGHQRGEKGYHLVPAIAEALLQGPHDIRLLLHNAHPDGMRPVQGALHAIAARDPRVTMDERPADQAMWGELLNRSDLILCPYHPPTYLGAYSAIVGEALAQGIPLVVPDATTLSRTLGEFGGAGAAFAAFEPASIVATTQAVLADFDGYAMKASAAAMKWHATMGPARMVDEILSLLPPVRRAPALVALDPTPDKKVA